MAAHRYWRIYFVASNSTVTNCAELELRESVGGVRVIRASTSLYKVIDFSLYEV